MDTSSSVPSGDPGGRRSRITFLSVLLALNNKLRRSVLERSTLPPVGGAGSRGYSGGSGRSGVLKSAWGEFYVILRYIYV